MSGSGSGRVITLTRPIGIVAIGALFPPDTEPAVVRPGAPIERASGPLGDVSEWREGLRKRSQVPRARSGAFATVSAAVLGRSLLGVARTPDGCTAIGVAMASMSSTIGVAHRYESTGRHESWSVVDPFGFSNSLPSAIAAQMALTLGLRAFAVTFVGDLFAFFGALTFSALNLARAGQRCALVIGADEVTHVQRAALAGAGLDVASAAEREGASGLLLSSDSAAQAEWKLTVLGCGAADDPATCLPPDWRDVPVDWIASNGGLPPLRSATPAIVLARALAQGPARILVGVRDPLLGWWVCGCSRDE